MRISKEDVLQAFREGRSKELIGSALAEQNELRGAVNSSPINELYENVLAVMTQVKHEQIDRIETRLEGLIDRQGAAQKQMLSQKPSVFAGLGARAKWQNAQAQTQARMFTLNTRLEQVREIKDGMGLHAPKVVEFATQKLKKEEPALLKDWEQMQVAQRVHQARLRKEEQERKQVASKSLGRGQSLSLSKSIS